MACYRPLKAYRRASGEIGFSEAAGDLESLELGCGRCAGCRLSRASSWSVRCLHEASLFEYNCFVTLTYDDKHLPPYGGLLYEDVQKFLKRLRKRERGIEPGPSGKYPIRFFCAGEYGEQSWRAHYHLLVFNFDFADKSGFSKDTFTSGLLSELWDKGTSLIGAVTPASCAYVARYCLKKVYGRAGEDFYDAAVSRETGEVFQVRPEFCVMSRRPGIGAWWFDKYTSDVLPRDYVVVDNSKRKVPRYYMDRFSKVAPLVAEEVREARYAKFKDMPVAERSVERRAVQEQVAVAQLDHSFGKRGDGYVESL